MKNSFTLSCDSCGTKVELEDGFDRFDKQVFISNCDLEIECEACGNIIEAMYEFKMFD